MLISGSEQIGKVELKQFLDMCEDIGMPMAPDKTFLPNTTMDFLGFEINTVNHMIKLPLDKLER
jgi:hypothetical protein